jgi:predicted ATPase/DNA-binding SARP family transcriptional activator
MAANVQPVRVSLLGPFSVEVDGNPVDGPWRLRKARTLVKLLALAPGHRSHRDVLLDRLWPDLDLGAALNNLHQAVHAARRVIGSSHLAVHDDVLELNAVSVDVDDFVGAAASALRSAAIDDLEAACALWGGPLLPEDEYEDWTRGDRDRLDALHRDVVVALAAELVGANRPHDALGLVDSVLIDAPYDERVHRVRLDALAAAGRRRDAETSYTELRRILADDLGAEPEEETVALYRRLFGGATPATAAANNLPSFASSFVGRRRELDELSRAFERARLVTLTGVGGSGKTRLAIEFAHRAALTGRYPDGVWLVEFAGVSHSDDVGSVVATALGLSMPGEPWIDAVVKQLSDRRLLLVLDNCEHVIDAVAPLAAGLLAGTRDVTMLTTSREALGRPDEVVWRVASLEVPGTVEDAGAGELGDVESVRLFVERARDVANDFSLDDETAPTIASICRRLDGIPLALELAAARTGHFSVAEIAERLDDALLLLARRGDGRLDRQQTLEATLEWSHALLTETERAAFRRLSVFANGFTLDAAEHVVGESDVLVGLTRLVDKSLVVADTTSRPTRYRLLEVVRQYARARLDESGEIKPFRARHREWFGAQATAHDPDRAGPVVLEPDRWFDAEIDNLRLALAGAFEDEPPAALPLAVSMWRFLLSRGQIAEAHQSLTAAIATSSDEDLLARALFGIGVLQVRRGQPAGLADLARRRVLLHESSDDVRLRTQALHDQATFLFMSGEWDSSEQVRNECRRLAGEEPATIANVAHLDGIAALNVGDTARARASFEEAAGALEDVESEADPFFVPVMLACTVDERGDFPIPIGEDSLLVGRRVGAAQATGWVGIAAGVADRLAGDHRTALARLDEAVRRFQALGDTYGSAFATAQRGHTLRWAGDGSGAVAAFTAAEATRKNLSDRRAIATAIAGRAVAEALLGLDGARETLGEAIDLMTRTGDVPGVAVTRLNGLAVEVFLGDLGAAVTAAERVIGMAAQAAPGIPVGWVQAALAEICARRGDAARVRRETTRAEAYFRRFGDNRGLSWVQRMRKASHANMPH